MGQPVQYKPEEKPRTKAEIDAIIRRVIIAHPEAIADILLNRDVEAWDKLQPFYGHWRAADRKALLDRWLEIFGVL